MKEKKTRKPRNLTLTMVAKWKGISRAAIYQAPTARREKYMQEFKEAIEKGETHDPRLD